MLERLFGKKKTNPTVAETDSGAKEVQTSSTDSDTSSSRADSQDKSSPQSHEGTEQPQTVNLSPSAGGEKRGGPDGPDAAHDLERAIVANARHDTPETRQKLYEELLFSNLLLALSDAPSDAPQVDAQKPGDTSGAGGGEKPQNGQEIDGRNISVAIIKNPTGMQFAAAFTSGKAARTWRAQGGNFVSVKGRDVYKLLEPSPADVIVINPGSSPFVVLPKVDYKQLALGVVPQNPQSPVHIPQAPQEGQQGQGSAQGGAGAAPGSPSEPSQGQVQVAFPPDVFTADQSSFIKTILMVHTHVAAAVFGAIRPPGAKENEWIRTIFVRPISVKQTQEAVQAFTNELRDAIVDNQTLFKETPFEVAVMPDVQFWVAMRQNNLALFDKNPPPLPAEEPEDATAGNAGGTRAAGPKSPPGGVVDAKVGS